MHTCTLIKDFLGTMDADAPRGSQGRRMMEDKLRLYLWWKGKLSERKAEGKGPIALPKGKDNAPDEISEALKRKDREKQERAASRRRVRGGAPAAAPTAREAAVARGEVEIKQEADDIADLCVLAGIQPSPYVALTSLGRTACRARALTRPRRR